MADVVTKSNRDIKSLQPLAQQAAQLFLDECKKQGLNVLVTEYHRSQARQNYLYEQGRTRPGSIVTWTKNSNHTAGYAWDVCKNIKGQEYSDKAFFDKCGKIAKGLGIEWGGDWKQRDTPHFQISSNWKAPVTTPNAPDWQVASLNNVIEKLGLDKAYWTVDKLSNNVTLGELMGLLNKIVK